MGGICIDYTNTLYVYIYPVKLCYIRICIHECIHIQALLQQMHEDTHCSP